MRRTSPLILIVFAAVGAIAGYLIDHTLTTAGMPTFLPSTLLPVMLVLLSIGIVVVAWPVRRSVRSGTRIDPFRALRIATLARAASLLGALAAGFGAGLALYLLSRPVPAQVGSIMVTIALVGSAVVLIAAALVAEWFCTLPKDPDEPARDDPAAEPEPGF